MSGSFVGNQEILAIIMIFLFVCFYFLAASIWALSSRPGVKPMPHAVEAQLLLILFLKINLVFN